MIEDIKEKKEMNLKTLVGRHKAIDIFFSSACNMACTYCYIPKTKRLNELNKNIVRALEDGSLIDTLEKVCSKDMKVVSLWGAEPTINSISAKKLFADIFTTFKEVEEVMFSTNALLGGDRVLEIVKGIESNIHLLNEEARRKFKVVIQLSLDGPAWITDATRHKGATEGVISTYKELVNRFQNKTNEFTDLEHVQMHFKPTISNEIFREFNRNPKLIKEWFLFFEGLYEYVANTPSSERGILTEVPLSLPTAVTPGMHTSEDGKEMTKFFRNIRVMNKSDLKYFSGTNLFRQMGLKLEEHILGGTLTAGRSAAMSCGGGDASYAIDHRGSLYPCHRGFGPIHYSDPQDGKNRTLIKHSVAKVNNQTEINRLAYNMRAVHDFPFFRYSLITAAVKQLALIGQADEIYLHDDNMCTLLAIAINGLYCHAGCAEDTTSSHIVTLSLIRLYANGALQEILANIKKERRL